MAVSFPSLHNGRLNLLQGIMMDSSDACFPHADMDSLPQDSVRLPSPIPLPVWPIATGFTSVSCDTPVASVHIAYSWIVGPKDKCLWQSQRGQFSLEKGRKNLSVILGMMAHAYNPSTWEAEAVSLGYTQRCHLQRRNKAHIYRKVPLLLFALELFQEPQSARKP